MTSKAEQLIELATDYQDKEEYSKAIKTYTEAISIINSEINNINDSYDYQELNGGCE